MDIMFSPYGVGGIPKDALEEIERKTQELLKTSSFREMLELENKCKTNQLVSIPYSATISGRPPSLSPQTEHPYLLSQQQHDLMLRVTSRNITVPPLSITIPQQSDCNKQDLPSQWETDDGDAEANTPTNTEPAHKQVKFLEDDAMSDQSSICQSPSWETYGQKKKEKKLEAERRKKEKADAEKDAKAAKKRVASRLSKLPPSTTMIVHDTRPNGLINAERSMSDPSLISQHLHKPLTQRPQDTERAVSTDNLQQLRRFQLTGTEAFPNNSSGQRMELRRTTSEGPGVCFHHTSQALVSKPDGRLSREPCPPSASRTPMLRHMSPPSHDRSQDSPSAHPSLESTRIEGYVRYQRAQSCERAMASLADEELLGNSSLRSSSRSSSCNPPPSRRSSLTQEAKTAAMKLVGMKITPAARNDCPSDNRPEVQGDYFGFPDQQAATSQLNATISQSSRTQQDASGLDRPLTSHSSLSSGGQSSAGSTSSSLSKKSRSLREAARSALHLSKGAQPSTDSQKSHTSMPPYFALRSRMQSRSSMSHESNISQTPPELHQMAEIGATSKQDTGQGSQTGSRISEGSSSSSASYEDGSSIPSPTTTPDTSRPQSAKDIPVGDSEIPKSSVKPSDSQPEQTVLQSPDSNNPVTSHLEETKAHGGPQTGDGDRWSRTALPVDIDCDAQSFTTTVSYLDNVDDTSPDHLPKPQLETEQEKSNVHEQPEQSPSSESWSDAQQYMGVSINDNHGNHSCFAEPTISIPPRSKKRDQSAASSARTSPTESYSQHAQQLAKDESESHGYSEPVENSSGGLPKPEQANKKQKRQSKSRELNANQQVSNRDTAESVATSSSFSTEYQMSSNPYFDELPAARQAMSATGSLPSSRPQSTSRPSSQPRTHSAPSLPAMVSPTPRTATSSPSPSSSTRSSKPPPVSILKQPRTHSSDTPSSQPPSPGRAPVLSALPKHMQLQAGISVRPPAISPEARISPIAKMFVECCSCKFYHDMPSKIYECMAKPDAVIEDRALGISGAITTMVKCPWCHHNMSTSCCAGYAAVVYLKEKLH